MSDILIIFLVPMIFLIPVEGAILYYIGDLESETIRAYAYCLLPKALGVVSVGYAATHGVFPSARGFLNVFLVEGSYSVIHFIGTLFILSKVFKIRRPAYTAGLISTFIPWAYSMGMVLWGFLFVAHH